MSETTPDFQIPDEILSVIPTDPYEQLDLARKITSMAIASRVTNLETEVSRLRLKVNEKDRVIVDLEDKVKQVQEAFQEAELRLRATLDDNMKLVKERDLLALTTKKLSRDLAKLETFKRQLMQSLSDDSPSPAQTVDIGTYDQSVSKGYGLKEEVNGYRRQKSLNGSVDSATMDDASRQKYAITQHVTPRLTPTGTPKVISTSVSPRGYSTATSPRKASGAISPIKGQYEGSGSISSWFPSSQQSSAANSPPRGRPLPGVVCHMSSSAPFWLILRNLMLKNNLVRKPYERQKRSLAKTTKIYISLSRVCLVETCVRILVCLYKIFVTRTLPLLFLYYRDKSVKTRLMVFIPVVCCPFWQSFGDGS